MRLVARIAIGFAAAIGAIVFAVAAAIAFLHAPWGASRIARVVEARASESLEGTVRIATLRPGAFGEIDARRILVLDPDGHPAIAVAHATLRIDPVALLRGTLRIEALRFEGARVELATSPEGGLALSRALRPKRAAPSKGARRGGKLPPAPPVPMILEELHVEGAFRMARRPGGKATVLVRNVDLDASGAWREHRARVSLTLTGDVEEPIRRPLAIGVVSRFEDDRLTAEPVDVRLGETRLLATGSGRPRDRVADVRFQGGVEAEIARRFGASLAKDLRFEGALRQAGLRTELDLRGGPTEGGEVHVAGTIEGPSKKTELHAELTGVDPSAWVQRAPKGSITGRVDAAGTMQPMELRGSAHLDPGRLQGEPLGPVEVEGAIRQGKGAGPRVEVGRLYARLPGAAVEGRGSFSPPAVDAHVSVRLEDLEELRGWLSRAFGLQVPPIEAVGTVDLHASGTTRDLPISLSARLSRIRAPSVAAAGVRVDATARVEAGSWPSGRVTARATNLRVSEYVFDEVTISGGRDPAGAFAIVLQTAPSSGERTGAALRADGIARPGFLKVALGRAALKGGDLDLEARGEAVLAEGRVTGRLEAAAGRVGVVRASYDGPVNPLRAPASAPVSAELLASPIDLGGVARILARPLPVGRVRARLAVAGTLGEPNLELDARGTGMWFARIPSVEPFDVRVSARHRASAGKWRRGDLEVAVDAWSGERRILELAAGAPVDLSALRATPRDEIAHMLSSPQARVAGEMRGIDLAVLGEAIGRPGLHGAAAATVDLRGPLRDPRGRFTVELHGGPLGPVRNVRALANADLGDDRVVVSALLDSEEADEARVRASLEVGTSLAVLLDRRADPATPITASIDLRRIDLEDLTSDRSEADGRLSGRISGRAAFSGTLEAPCGDGIFRATGLGARGARFGDMELSVAMNASRLQARLHAFEEGGGTLAAGVEVGERWFARLVAGDADAIASLPTRLRVEATRLSLAPLGGILPVGYLAGTLDASLEADGPLASITPVGVIAVEDGAVEVPGGAIFDRIAMRLVFREDVIELQALDIHGSGGGAFFASGTVGEPGSRPVRTIVASLIPFERTRATGSVPFGLDLRADSLRVSGPGGPLARITLRDRLEGTIGPTSGLSATLTVASAMVELPPKPPRSLQPLGPLPDVVMVPGTKGPGAGPTPRKRQVLPLSLHVIAPGDIAITGQDVTLEARADLFVTRAHDGTLAASGYVRTTRGEVTVVGRTFEVEHAELRWTGGPPRNPHVNVTARYDAPQATAWADIGGTLRDPSVHLRSEPPLSESQIIMLVVAGRAENPGTLPMEGRPREGQAGQGAATSLAGAAVTQKLRQSLGPRIPVQILTSQTPTGQTVVEAGTVVARNLYVGFVRNFLAEPGENTNEVHAQYELSRTVGLRARFGDAGAGGVDVVWEKQIATPAQQRARKAAPPPEPPPAPEGETPPESAPVD